MKKKVIASILAASMAAMASTFQYRRFRNKDSFDFADLDENPFYYMDLRVLKFPISETDYECILTNLPEKERSAFRVHLQFESATVS